jgi:hypothetical protein
LVLKNTPAEAAPLKSPTFSTASVKTGKPRSEHMFYALHPKADTAKRMNSTA